MNCKNEIEKDAAEEGKKKNEYGKKYSGHEKISPVCLTVAWAYLPPPPGSLLPEVVDEFLTSLT